MKKVLAIAPYSYLPYFSGGQKFIAKFFEYLSKEVDLTVVSVEQNDRSLANYKILPLLKKSFSRYYDRSLIAGLSELVRDEKFDAIIWEHPYYYWLAKRVRNRTGIKTIIHTHNIEYRRFKSLGKWWWPILRRYERKCLQHADAVFFITPDDRRFAIDHWNIPEEKTTIVPFGVDEAEDPTAKIIAKQEIVRRHQLDPSDKIFLFNGLLNYEPNLDALRMILDEINPHLLRSDVKYKIIVCGKGLPEEMNALRDQSAKNIMYAGFVNDIETYFKAADIFLNPVLSGGGIKTKMVEAIGFGTSVISTESGAIGLDRTVSAGKLVVVPDSDWKAFAEQTIRMSSHAYISTPPDYYREYGWKNIVKRTLPFLT
jgi:glycosyltransferase involved in cell wall biosynthesis